MRNQNGFKISICPRKYRYVSTMKQEVNTSAAPSLSVDSSAVFAQLHLTSFHIL